MNVFARQSIRVFLQLYFRSNDAQYLMTQKRA